MSDLVSCACGDQYPADSYGAGWLNAMGRCPNCCAEHEGAGLWMTNQQAAGALSQIASDIDCASSAGSRLSRDDKDTIKAIVCVIYVAAEKIGGDQ